MLSAFEKDLKKKKKGHTLLTQGNCSLKRKEAVEQLSIRWGGECLWSGASGRAYQRRYLWEEGGTGMRQVREGHFRQRIQYIQRAVSKREQSMYSFLELERFVKLEHWDMEGRGNGVDLSSGQVWGAGEKFKCVCPAGSCIHELV